MDKSLVERLERTEANARRCRITLCDYVTWTKYNGIALCSQHAVQLRLVEIEDCFAGE
jgi:hypothetical protein